MHRLERKEMSNITLTFTRVELRTDSKRNHKSTDSLFSDAWLLPSGGHIGHCVVKTEDLDGSRSLIGAIHHVTHSPPIDIFSRFNSSRCGMQPPSKRVPSTWVTLPVLVYLFCFLT